MSERTPTDVLAERARHEARLREPSRVSSLLTTLAKRLDELKDAAAERDRAHATLREIRAHVVEDDDGAPLPEDGGNRHVRLARERLENP